MKVPAAEAWDLLGSRFGEIATWASPIVESALDGPAPDTGVARTCTFANFGPFTGGTVTERLLAFDAVDMSLAYRAETGMPGFIADAVNRWSVLAAGVDRCVVRVRATITLVWWARPLGPLLRWRTRRDADAVMADLAHRLETGAPRSHTVGGRSPDPRVRR